MTPTTLLYVKYGLVGIAIAGCVVLVIMGKLDVASFQSTVVGLVGALVVALGIASAGQHVGNSLSSSQPDTKPTDATK